MKNPRFTITAAIIVRNGEKTIKECLNSIKWCDEIVVVDDYSTDKTIEFARKFGARIFKRKLEGDFAGQRNFALKKSKGKWVLFIDADEMVTEGLREEIIQSLETVPKNVTGFSFRRIDYFLGRQLKHGPAAKSYFFRLIKKGKGKWVVPQPEILETSGEVGCFKNKVIHHRKENISDFVKKYNFYSSLEAGVRFKKGEKTNLIKIIYIPTKYFFSTYIADLGFLDGLPGFILCSMVFFIQFLIQVKLWEKTKVK